MNEQWILDDYERAVARLTDALSEPAENDLLKAGCIQYFEFCFELAWKSIKVCGEALGLENCLSPKSCLKQAYRQNWIGDESVWLDMLEARNRMSHTYSASRALGVYDRLTAFLPELTVLHENLSTLAANKEL
jgi:nucleotidyltransferase substrate binding protein (TIGR01987 family)